MIVRIKARDRELIPNKGLVFLAFVEFLDILLQRHYFFVKIVETVSKSVLSPVHNSQKLNHCVMSRDWEVVVADFRWSF